MEHDFTLNSKAGEAVDHGPGSWHNPTSEGADVHRTWANSHYMNRQILVPGYTPIRELDRGGQGTVYLAKHTSLDRLVALKLIRLDSEEARIRLIREIQAMMKLKHQVIVQVLYYALGFRQCPVTWPDFHHRKRRVRCAVGSGGASEPQHLPVLPYFPATCGSCSISGCPWDS